jgi:60 kDa SS-A/Ro ribonucleoprotein
VTAVKKSKKSTNYAALAGIGVTPQTQPAFGKDQVPNSAGGFVFDIGPWQALDRFLILGAESRTYYASARALTAKNAENVLLCIAQDGPRAVARIVELSLSGRAPKQDPLLFALALAAKKGDQTTQEAAYKAVTSVCRTGTQLFTFVSYADALGGWGDGMKRAIARWYSDKSAHDLAYQVTKYASRTVAGKTWTHRDLLRLAHPKPTLLTPQMFLYPYITTGVFSPGAVLFTDDPDGGNAGADDWAMAQGYIEAVEALKGGLVGPQGACELIEKWNLPREVVPTELLKNPTVWEALLQRMPYEALLRNVATLTKVGVIAPNSDGLAQALRLLGNADKLKRSRVHPITVLKALMQYREGHGRRSDATWTPVAALETALEDTFYAAFGNVPVTGKRWGLFLDVSGSMTVGDVAGMEGLTPRAASVALALVTARVEPLHVLAGFTSGGWVFGARDTEGITQLKITANTSLDQALSYVDKLPFGGTDCALPMLWAAKNKVPIDVFVTMTDNETWAGDIQPFQALEQYRQKLGIDARAIVVGMTATKFSIADPSDPRQLDVVGFDAGAPQVMADFATGQLS